MKSAVKYTLAGMLFVVGIGGSIVWNEFVAPKLNSEAVWVATESLSPNRMLGPAQVHKEMLPRSDVPMGAVTHVQAWLGEYTTESLTPRQVLTTADLESDPFAITRGTEDVPLDASWIASVSPTLRAGDRVTLTFLPSQGAKTGRLTSFSDVLVLSVHTSNNREVVTAMPTHGPSGVGAPVNGIGVPNEVDVKLTQDQMLALAEAVARGEKVLISGS